MDFNHTYRIRMAPYREDDSRTHVYEYYLTGKHFITRTEESWQVFSPPIILRGDEQEPRCKLYPVDTFTAEEVSEEEANGHPTAPHICDHVYTDEVLNVVEQLRQGVVGIPSFLYVMPQQFNINEFCLVFKNEDDRFSVTVEFLHAKYCGRFEKAVAAVNVKWDVLYKSQHARYPIKDGSINFPKALGKIKEAVTNHWIQRERCNANEKLRRQAEVWGSRYKEMFGERFIPGKPYHHVGITGQSNGDVVVQTHMPLSFLASLLEKGLAPADLDVSVSLTLNEWQFGEFVKLCETRESTPG